MRPIIRPSDRTRIQVVRILFPAAILAGIDEQQQQLDKASAPWPLSCNKMANTPSFAHNGPSRPWESTDRSASGRDLGLTSADFFSIKNTARSVDQQLPHRPPKQCSPMLPNFDKPSIGRCTPSRSDCLVGGGSAN